MPDFSEEAVVDGAQRRGRPARRAVAWLLVAAVLVIALAGTGMVRDRTATGGAQDRGGAAAGEAPEGAATLSEVLDSSSEIALARPLAGGGRGRVVTLPVRSGRSAPIRSQVPVPGGGTYVDPGLKPRKSLAGRSRPDAPVPTRPTDGAVQDSISTSALPATPVVSFDGLDNRNALLPADPTGAIGPDHFVQAVNSSFAIYDRAGATVFGPSNLNVLWAGLGGVCDTRNDGDPIVLYDHLADRWLVTRFAIPGGTIGYHQCVAVSASGDPTGSWFRYDYLISTLKLNDYPKFGVWPDGYYMTANQFLSGRWWAGSLVGVFERERMLLGDPGARLVMIDLESVDPTIAGVLPADLDGPAPPAGTPGLVAAVYDDTWEGSDGLDRLRLWELDVDWTAESVAFVDIASLPVAAFDSNLCRYSRSCIPQRDSTARLDPLPDRLMFRLQYRVRDGVPNLVVNHTVDATGTDRAGVRWYQLERRDGDWQIRQQGTLAPNDGLHRWMASVAQNAAGDLGLGYSVSGSTLNPAIRLSGKPGSDVADGRLTIAETSLIEGPGAQTASASRWGDYAQISVDPRDDCTFWVTSEYVASTGLAPWRTRIGSFRISSCGIVPGTIAGVVTDGVTGLPLVGATVALQGVGTATTGTGGTFTLGGVHPDTYLATVGAAGYLDRTAGVVVRSGETVQLSVALGPLGSTGWVAPDRSAPGPGGDGDGYEAGMSLATIASGDGATATDGASGTKGSTKCDSSARDSHDFRVALPVPSGRTIVGIGVRLRASANSTSGSPRLCVLLSWNGGLSWTDPKTTAFLGTKGAEYLVGSTSDRWQVARRDRSWTTGELEALIVRIVDVGTNTSTSYYLDEVVASATFR